LSVFLWEGLRPMHTLLYTLLEPQVQPGMPDVRLRQNSVIATGCDARRCGCDFMALRAASRLVISNIALTSRRVASRSMSGTVVNGFRTFELAMIQLGGIQDDKKANLAHAATMIRKAAKGNGKGKIDLVMLPVCQILRR
jgi:hypothetical protein